MTSAGPTPRMSTVWGMLPCDDEAGNESSLAARHVHPGGDVDEPRHRIGSDIGVVDFQEGDARRSRWG
jgi:hypothetical protein